ncbi:type II toxin-antitoxin system RelE/ParE family toxin [Winslowiella toletana]|uniref:type II toxin-antitoxin system RelE/ParE family toxin n=1 Tax=Winslowiella toletana TaxID=92490 RepID=UPI0028BD4912|nr:hypothetical protein [Winslowiella toletana]WNN44441.1 hypothetical protein RIN69_00550 [Winslowiella toletana]
MDLRDTLHLLASHPNISRTEDLTLLPGVFSLSYVIYYLQPPGGVEVIGVIHQSRMPKILLTRKL